MWPSRSSARSGGPSAPRSGPRSKPKRLRRQPLPRLLVRLEAAAAGALVLGQRHAAAAAAALGEAGEVHLLPVGGTVQRAPLTRQLLRQQLVQTEAMIKVEPGLVLWLLKTECTRPCVTEPPIER